MPKKKFTRASQEPGAWAQLIQACRELNPQVDEGLLQQCAEWLEISCFSGGLNDRPNLRQKGGTRAKVQLLELARDLAKVRKNLAKMNVEARTALKDVQASEAEAARQANKGKTFPSLRRTAPDVTMMEFFVEEYILQACQAHDTLSKSPAPKGAPKKHRPKEVTKMAIRVYEVLTQQPARQAKKTDTHEPYSPFFIFLTKIFKILDLPDSPESQADAVLYSSDSPR